MTVLMSFAMNGWGPRIDQVTSVLPSRGASVNSTTLCASNGVNMSSAMTTLDGGTESVMAMRPRPTWRFPFHSNTAPLPAAEPL